MTFHFLAHARAFAPDLIHPKAASRSRVTAVPFARAPLACKRPRSGLAMHWASRNGRLEMRWANAADTP